MSLYLFIILPILEARAEILKKRWFFGTNDDDIKKSFEINWYLAVVTVQDFFDQFGLQTTYASISNHVIVRTTKIMSRADKNRPISRKQCTFKFKVLKKIRNIPLIFDVQK